MLAAYIVLIYLLGLTRSAVLVDFQVAQPPAVPGNVQPYVILPSRLEVQKWCSIRLQRIVDMLDRGLVSP